MSSFIVSQECMNNIVNGLFWNHGFKNQWGSMLEDRGLKEWEDYKAFGDELYNLNALGTGSRYGDEQMLKTVYKYEVDADWKSISDVQLLKSLQCLLYQCSEDRADETELYKFLENLIINLKTYIISKLPGYEDARWD